jgi:hypothetical protein
MALTGLTNLAESYANQLEGQGQTTLQGELNSIISNAAAPATPIEDVFTPSVATNTAQDAGLFQISQFSLFPGQQSAASIPPSAQAISLPQANTDTAQPAIPVTDLTASPGAQAVAALPSPNVPPANHQNRIQFFNEALTALGLQNNDIQKLDQIATLVNDFSPTAFSDLISQFRALAQQQGQLTASASAPGANAVSGGFQVQALAIQFAGSQNQPGPGGNQTGSQSDGTAAGLQIEGLQFSLLNGAGQTVNLLAPLPNTTAAGTTQKIRGATA